MFQIPIRQILFRTKRPATLYRILFIIREDTPDGRLVWIVHIRPATSASISSYEARNIQAAIDKD